ncbi:testis-expressed protein 26-like [Silurus meridionalis]|uniref:Testis-expressed protein 26 n=1 Tax=Silurus meridionalis TaxID=175797 RepID=A0A8T0B7I2_SILME|nr:testis-expressed protein 26-like [Silurus meridionalis]KAF7700316.1 hypothetical protein HF521_003274 [Silurus meridionalis]
MANCDKKKWDPFDTSQKRDFISRPLSPITVLRPSTAKAYRNQYALADPIGMTAYSEDFCWKPPSKPDCIRTGTASGNRRNNPHPSQGFMVWRHPPGLKLCEKTLPEDDVKNALSAQYKSTYSRDFLGIPQGIMMNHTALDRKNISEVPRWIQTEMRYNYRKPVQRPEFREKTSRREASKGIIPTVIPKHITNQEITKPLTTYDKHFSGKSTDFASVLSSLQREELQQFYKQLPEKEKLVMQKFLATNQRAPGQGKKIMEPVAFTQPPAVLDRISVWPGPL